jgi:hypothetical protein
MRFDRDVVERAPLFSGHSEYHVLVPVYVRLKVLLVGQRSRRVAQSQYG